MKTSSYTHSPSIPAEDVEKNVTAFIGREERDPQELKQVSPIEIPEFGPQQTITLLSHLYTPEECINILEKVPGKDGNLKKKKFSRGETFTQHSWIALINKIDWSVPEDPSTASHEVLFTINPITKVPKYEGRYCRDADCTGHRYLLAECDGLRVRRQAALLMGFPLPIKAIISSGGRSLHAILEINAEGPKSYSYIAKSLMLMLKFIGFDHSCSNPSRKSRLPGFTREDPDTKEVRPQELLYLNPNPEMKPIL